MVMHEGSDGDDLVVASTEVSAAADKNGGTEVKRDALFRWQKDLDDPHTFMDLLVSTSKLMLQLRSCAYYPKYRIGAFGTLPLLVGNRVHSEDYGVVGVRYGSENLSFGASFVPFPRGNKDLMPFTDLKNWNYAISYGVGSASPLSPSFIFSLELARSTQVKNPFEDDQIVGITNYIDFGLELATRMMCADSIRSMILSSSFLEKMAKRISVGV